MCTEWKYIFGAFFYGVVWSKPHRSVKFVAADIRSVTIRDFSHKRISDPLRSMVHSKTDPLCDIFKGGYPFRNNPWASRRADIRSVTSLKQKRCAPYCAVETVKIGFSTKRFDALRSISHGSNRWKSRFPQGRNCSEYRIIYRRPTWCNSVCLLWRP